MRRLGNASGKYVSASSAFDDPFESVFPGFDSHTAPAATEIELPKVLSTLLSDEADDAGATQAVPALQPSLSDWIAKFKPFEASLGADENDTGPRANVSAEGDRSDDTDVVAHTSSASFPHIISDASDATSLAKINQDGLQKLYEHLADLDRDQSHTLQTFSHEPISPATLPAVASPEAMNAIGGPHNHIDSNPETSGAVTILYGGENGISTVTSQPTVTGSGSSATSGGFSSAGLIINVSYDASVASAPAGFKTAVDAVVQWFESHFSDPITINIGVGYGEVGGQTMGAGSLGQSMYFLGSYNYSTVKNALAADATTTSDATALASLPSTNPTGNGTFWLATAEAKALGLASGSTIDGYVGFSSGANTFDFNNADGVTAGQFDFMGTAFHEISEVL